MISVVKGIFFGQRISISGKQNFPDQPNSLISRKAFPEVIFTQNKHSLKEIYSGVYKKGPNNTLTCRDNVGPYYIIYCFRSLAIQLPVWILSKLLYIIWFLHFILDVLYLTDNTVEDTVPISIHQHNKCILLFQCNAFSQPLKKRLLNCLAKKKKKKREKNSNTFQVSPRNSLNPKFGGYLQQCLYLFLKTCFLTWEYIFLVFSFFFLIFNFNTRYNFYSNII